MYRISIDSLPPSLNRFYSGMHWARRLKIVNEWHGLFMAAFQDAGLPKKLSTPLIIHATQFCKGVVRDADGSIMSAKLCLDALVLYGYIPDDTPEYVKTVILQTKKGKSNKTVILLLDGAVDNSLIMA